MNEGNKNSSFRKEVNALQTSIQKLSNNHLFSQVYGDLLKDLTSLLNDLEGSYQNFNLLSEASKDVIFRISLSGEIILISDSCKEMFGFNKEELTGKQLDKIIKIEKANSSISLQEIFFKAVKETSFKGSVTHKNGHKVPVEIIGKTITLDEENIFQGSIKDITQYIRSQLQLASSENTFRRIWEESYDGMTLTDEDGIIQMCNKSFADFADKKKFEIEQFPFTVIYDNSNKQELLEKHKNDFRKRSFQSNIETSFKLWNSKHADLEISNEFIEIDNKTLLLTIYRDVTERYQNANLLIKKDILLNGIAEATKSFISDNNTEQDFNSALKILGTSAQVDRTYIYKHQVNNNTGETYMSLLYEWISDSIEAQIKNPMLKRLSYSRFSTLDFYESLSAGKTLKFIIKNLSLNEQQVFIDQKVKSIIIVPIIINGAYWGFIGFDDCTIDREWNPNEESLLITIASTLGAVLEKNQNQDELIKKYNELDEAVKKAETTEKAKNEFLSLMGHEIRTPMNAIIGMTGLLNNTELNDEQKEYVGTIHSSGDQLLIVINDILDYSKMESGMLDLEIKPFDLRDCIEDSLDLFASQAAEKKIDLAYLIESTTPVAINGDVTRIGQILTNLLGNAIKFTEKGEVFISASAKPLEKDKYEILISIKDTGNGISPDMLEKLFQPFNHLERFDSKQNNGSGLGLAISKKLSELMGGMMWVESKEGKGTKFFFTIIAESVSSVSKVYLRGKTQQLKDKRILIVDDNDTNRKILITQVEIWGMKYKATDNPSIALNWLRNDEVFDIAILDYNMPMMNGMTLSGEIKKISGCEDMPIIILTSFGKEETLSTGDKDNVDAVITKPIKHSQLQEYIIQNLAKVPKKPAKGIVKEKTTELDEPGNKYPLNILIGEDNIVNQKVAKRILERLGYSVDIASTGNEVVKAAKNKKYDLILMDIYMPEINGYEAAKAIRKELHKDEQPVIIAMTANNLQESEKEFEASGMNDFIEKPVNYIQMKRVITEWSENIYKKKQNEFFDRKGEPAMIDFKKITALHDIQTDEDVNFLKELIDTYINDLPSAAQELASYVEKEDCKMIKFVAHKLKGGSVTVGIDVMTDLTRKIEESVNGNKVTEETRLLTVNLLEYCEPIVEELKYLKERYIQV